MLITIIKLYLIVGLCWSCLFTGQYVIKALKGCSSGALKFDGALLCLLIALFMISWFGWPWSLKNNLSCVLELFKGGKDDPSI